jgi:pSer/pThr/pTyr-binding forkhead associated (FHA) protein
MDIEIVVVGESSKWVLNQPRIRIGQDPKCEVSLPAGKYPSVSGEHVALDVANGTVWLTKGMRSSGETYLNGRPADSGAAVRSGDVLRLGAGGPELRIRLLERDAYAMPAEYEPTRVLYEPAESMHEPTRVMQEPTRVTHEPTRVISSATAASFSPATRPAAGAPARPNYSPQAAYGAAAIPSPSLATPRRPDAGANAVGAQPSYGQPRGPQPLPQAAAASPADGASLRILEARLKTIRLILLANLAVLVALLAWIYIQGQELAQTHKDLQALRMQTQSAVGQFAPALDARLKTFDDRMDGMDMKIAVAQDRLVKGMDAQAKLAEDRMVERMNTEIPAMLDKYVAKKMAEVKH